MYCIIDQFLEYFTYIHRAQSEFNVTAVSFSTTEYVWMTVQNRIFALQKNQLTRNRKRRKFKGDSHTISSISDTDVWQFKRICFLRPENPHASTQLIFPFTVRCQLVVLLSIWFDTVLVFHRKRRRNKRQSYSN